MKHILPFLLLTVISGCSVAQSPRNLLGSFTQQQIAEALLPAGKWHPFPNTGKEWQEALPENARRRIVQQAETYARIPFVAIPASVMLEYQQNGDRSHYEQSSFRKRDQLFVLALAESIEQKGRFMQPVMDGIWSICEESYWGAPGHLYFQKAGIDLVDVEDPTVDLFVSETATVLALTDYLLGAKLDSISRLLRRRIYYEVNKRMLTPLEKDSDRYYYLKKGTPKQPLNNWNPWVISNWMTSLLLLEKNNERRAKELEHSMRLLDHYIDFIPDDGAIDEGPVYWSGATGRLFDALTVLESATAGKINIYKEPIFRNMASYIYKMHIAGNYYVNVADASPVITTDGLLLYRMGTALEDSVMTSFGAWAFHQYPVGSPVNTDFAKPRMLFNVKAWDACSRSKGQPPMLQDIWLESIQLMAARTEGGLFVAAHGGHNAESHNHNDVGDFMVYAAGQPVIIDVGLGTYTAKTFSKDRYQLWYNSSAYHNLPVINGYQQLAGRQYAARAVRYQQEKDNTLLRMDIAAAYPPEAGITEWDRNVTLQRSQDEIVVTDNFTLQRSSRLTQTFMTVCATDIRQPGRILFETADKRKVVLEYDPEVWNVTKELMNCSAPDEKRLTENWSRQQITRLLLTVKDPVTKGTFNYRIRQI